MFKQILSIIILTLTINSLKSWDDYKDINMEEHLLTLTNQREKETLKNCQAVKNFINSIKENEKLILSYRENKNENVVTKNFFDLKNKVVYKKLEKVIISKKIELENLFMNLNALNLENSELEQNLEIKMKPLDLLKKGSFLKHLNSFTQIVKDEPESRLGKEKRFSQNYEKLGRMFSSLMFINNYNGTDDFICYRVDQISLVIFEMAHLRYIKHHEDLKNLLKGFLEAFFEHFPNKKEKKIFHNLFRSFYSFHLHLFLRFNQNLTNTLMELLSNLRDQHNKDLLINDFINVYLKIADDLDQFSFNTDRKYQKNLDLAKQDAKKFGGETLIFGILYALGKLEALLEFPGVDVVKYLLRDQIGALHRKLENILRKNLKDKKPEFIEQMNFNIANHNFNISSVDIVNIFKLIKQAENGRENVVFADAVDMSDYFINRDFEEDNFIL